MSQKRKSPPAATEGQAKLAKFACNYVATPARPAQAESCDRCQFFRAVALPSGRNRLLCMLTGEKLRTAAVGCDLFTPGKWEELWANPNPSPLPKWLLRTAERLRPLTRALALGMVETPNNVRRNRRLCRAPHGEKSGLFCFVSTSATGASCRRRYILAKRRPVPARAGGLTLAGERRFAFFAPNHLTLQENRHD